jgi:hypothetical protein
VFDLEVRSRDPYEGRRSSDSGEGSWGRDAAEGLMLVTSRTGDAGMIVEE